MENTVTYIPENVKFRLFYSYFTHFDWSVYFKQVIENKYLGIYYIFDTYSLRATYLILWKFQKKLHYYYNDL